MHSWSLWIVGAKIGEWDCFLFTVWFPESSCVGRVQRVSRLFLCGKGVRGFPDSSCVGGAWKDFQTLPVWAGHEKISRPFLCGWGMKRFPDPSCVGGAWKGLHPSCVGGVREGFQTLPVWAGWEREYGILHRNHGNTSLQSKRLML